METCQLKVWKDKDGRNMLQVDTCSLPISEIRRFEKVGDPLSRNRKQCRIFLKDGATIDVEESYQQIQSAIKADPEP